MTANTVFCADTSVFTVVVQCLLKLRGDSAVVDERDCGLQRNT